MRLRYAAMLTVVVALEGCGSPWADRGKAATMQELQGSWAPGVSLPLAAGPSSNDGIELLDGSTCKSSEAFAKFFTQCRGEVMAPSSMCRWHMKNGDTGQWVTVVLGEEKDGNLRALPMMIKQARLTQETVLVTLCTNGEPEELVRVQRSARN